MDNLCNSLNKKVAVMLLGFVLLAALGKSLSFSREGKKIPKELKLDECRRSVKNLIKILDELYKTLESGNNADIEVKIKEYLNVSKIAVENVSNLLIAFEDVTGFCTSLENYNQARSNLYNAMIDLSTDTFILTSDLGTYLEEPENTNLLDKVKEQINKTSESAYSVRDSLSGIENIIRLWIPTVIKTVPATEIGSDVPIDFTIYNIGTLEASNISAEMILPENVSATETTWNIDNLAPGENVTLYSNISFNKSEDFIIELLASDSEGHKATGAIYIDIISILSANFTGVFSDYGVDTDGDSLYNRLAIDVGVNVKTAGTYVVRAKLHDPHGSQILETKESYFLGVGDHSITLNFNGFSIFKHKLGGPYVVILTLEDKDGNVLDSQTYNTSTYDPADFQHLVALTGNYWDYGTDIDGDGVLDYLTVNVEVVAVNPGYCSIKGRLMDINEKEIVWAENTAYLEADEPQVIQLNFDGATIYNHGVDGPYSLRDVYVYHTGDPTQPDYVYEAYTTSAYSYLKFGALPGDLDGDGDVDRDDLNKLLKYRNQPASECPECDLDGDGVITVLDARKLVLLCTRPRCACE